MNVVCVPKNKEYCFSGTLTEINFSGNLLEYMLGP